MRDISGGPTIRLPTLAASSYRVRCAQVTACAYAATMWIEMLVELCGHTTELYPVTYELTHLYPCTLPLSV